MVEALVRVAVVLIRQSPETGVEFVLGMGCRLPRREEALVVAVGLVWEAIS